MKTMLLILLILTFFAVIFVPLSIFSSGYYHYIATDLSKDDIIALYRINGDNRVWIDDITEIDDSVWHITFRARFYAGNNDLSYVLAQHHFEFHRLALPRDTRTDKLRK